MLQLADYAAETRRKGDRERSCLYVAKGPTAVHAHDHLGAGDLATVNNAGLLFPAVDWSFWCDVPPNPEISEMRERCRMFIVPDRLHTGAIDYWRTLGANHDCDCPSPLFSATFPDRRASVSKGVVASGYNGGEEVGGLEFGMRSGKCGTESRGREAGVRGQMCPSGRKSIVQCVLRKNRSER